MDKSFAKSDEESSISDNEADRSGVQNLENENLDDGFFINLGIASFILFLFIFIIKYFEETSDLPRICCANHKLNLAVKLAIREHKTIERHFRLLNNFISKIKRTIQPNRIFANAKCRLRLENITRWGSGFLMLETIRKADRLGLLKHDLKSPVAMTIIED